MTDFLEKINSFGFDNVSICGENIAKVWDDDLFGDENKVAYFETAGKSEPEGAKAQRGKLIFVTAITPNQYGVGKTTVSIGLADALSRLGKKTILSLREPSMGPVFGVKGGATGGGASTLEPSQKIDLHFTGDFHAIAQANNLLASIIDNHIYFGNELNIDTKSIFFKRCLDVNDRSLREISYHIRGEEVVTGFNITAASEVMAVVCLSRTKAELVKNLGNILVAKDKAGKPVFARDLKAEGAMALLLEDCIKPNAVFSHEGTLALVHMGPFANIAHGSSSIYASHLALSHADFCVTEGGFGCDLGGEKFVDITSRVLGCDPDAAVLVVTVKAVKEQGGGDLVRGFENVKRHMKMLQEVFEVPFVVAINRHTDDEQNDLEKIRNLCEKEGAVAAVCSPYDLGGEGCEALAKRVLSVANGRKKVCRTYEMSDQIEEKIEAVAKRVYGASEVEFSPLAREKIDFAKKCGFADFYVNIAKTPLSLSDDKKLLGAPKNFTFHITDVEIRSGAKMIVAIAGDILLMPGLARKSRYLDFEETPMFFNADTKN